MTKENIIENESTGLFLDLACRSFEASWKVFLEINGEGGSDELLDDPDFMSPFIINIIDHITKSYEKFTAQEGNMGDINEINIEKVAALLVSYTKSFK
ncbi:hypothetical protein [Xenorhabdus bovienii]|uniref:Uncharacterized protein n=1 Tax=Xenorhabdus bovienii TaxID=40576 RepID=A0A0B6XAP0_XENBV|nr:hypothetical protein [Xenorhabdus bovienii]CDM89788.1 conserved protein of unknown function [Xenorhabdus bovienii]